MEQFKWLTHQNYLGKTHYCNHKGNWNAQVRLYNIAGTNQKNTSHKSAHYEVYVNDGHGKHERLVVVQGLQQAKRKAESLLLHTYKTYRKK